VYGTALYNGDGVPQDQILGYAFVSRAAAQGLGAAKDTLAQLDEIMPVEDRKKGVALAMARAKATPPPASKPAAPKTAKLSAPKQPPAKPALAATTPKPVVKPPQISAGAATGSWRIQLGAFSQRSSAEALFRKVSGALAGRQAYYVSAGAVTRLQVGPFESKAAAAAACRTIGQACFPVSGK
jgi:hypothetical protein